MDIDEINFRLFTNHSLRGSDILSVGNAICNEDDRSPLFVNYAMIAWHELRRAWRGDRSGSSQRKSREPSKHGSSAVKGESLSSNESFDGPVPLSKMVEFLVEMWEEDLQD